MLQTIITVLIILSALASSSWLSRRAPKRCQQILARTAVLAIGVSIAFCVAQAAAAAGFLSLTLSYTPLDVLALLCVIYWLSFSPREAPTPLQKICACEPKRRRSP